MEPKKNEIKAMQGLSVLAMICLHLFCRYDYAGLYTPLLFFHGRPVSFYLAQASDFCVAGFAFCSGYALSVQLSRILSPAEYYSGRITSLLRLICKYHVVLIAFSLISIIAGSTSHMPGSMSKFLGNLLLYNVSYNGAWWYLTTYIFIVLTSYPIIKWILSHNTILSIPLWIALYFVCYVLRFDYGSEQWLIRQGYLYGMTLSQFAVGVYFFKHRLFSHASAIAVRLPLRRTILLFLVLLTIFTRTHFLPTLFVAPASGIVFLLAFHILYGGNPIFRFFEFIGKHSTNLWLTHMFFYMYIFDNLVFLFRWPILIFAAMLLITIFVSKALMLVQEPLCRRIHVKIS